MKSIATIGNIPHFNYAMLRPLVRHLSPLGSFNISHACTLTLCLTLYLTVDYWEYQAAMVYQFVMNCTKAGLVKRRAPLRSFRPRTYGTQ